MAYLPFGNSIQVQVDFGFASGGEGDTASATMAANWVSNNSKFSCSAIGKITADHDIEDPLVEGLNAYVTNIIPGVSFDVQAYSPNNTWGRYLIGVIGTNV